MTVSMIWKMWLKALTLGPGCRAAGPVTRSEHPGVGPRLIEPIPLHCISQLSYLNWYAFNSNWLWFKLSFKAVNRDSGIIFCCNHSIHMPCQCQQVDCSQIVFSVALVPDALMLESPAPGPSHGPSGRLSYMISYMISRNYDIACDIICLELSMIA